MEILDLKVVTENVLDMFNSRYEMAKKKRKRNTPNFMKNH